MLPVAAPRPPNGPQGAPRPFPRPPGPQDRPHAPQPLSANVASNPPLASPPAGYGVGGGAAVGSPRTKAMRMAQQQQQQPVTLNARSPAAVNGLVGASGSLTLTAGAPNSRRQSPPLSMGMPPGMAGMPGGFPMGRVSPSYSTLSNHLASPHHVMSGGASNPAMWTSRRYSNSNSSPPINGDLRVGSGPAGHTAPGSSPTTANAYPAGGRPQALQPQQQLSSGGGPSRSPSNSARPVPPPPMVRGPPPTNQPGNVAHGVPPPVARGPQPTCLEPTRLPNGQRIKRSTNSAQAGPAGGAANGYQGVRRVSRFASMRQLPGGVHVEQSDPSDSDSITGDVEKGKPDGGEVARKQLRTGPGPDGIRANTATEKRGEEPKRKIRTTEGNDDTWMRGLTYTTSVDSPIMSMRGENGPYKRKPKNAPRRKKNDDRSGKGDKSGNGDGDSNGSGNRSKMTFVEKLKALFA